MFLWRFGCCEVRWGKAQHGLAEEEPGLVWRAQQVAVPVSNRVTETSWSDLFCREWHAKVTELCQNHNSRQVLQVWEHLELVFGVTPDMTMTWLWHDYDMTMTWLWHDDVSITWCASRRSLITASGCSHPAPHSALGTSSAQESPKPCTILSLNRLNIWLHLFLIHSNYYKVLIHNFFCSIRGSHTNPPKS